MDFKPEWKLLELSINVHGLELGFSVIIFAFDFWCPFHFGCLVFILHDNKAVIAAD